MAVISQFVDLSLNRQSLIAAKIYPLTSAARTALAPVAGDVGMLVYDTTLNSLQAWNGVAWQNANPTGAGGMAFKGTIAASAGQPGGAVAGDMYVFSSAGTTSWAQSAIVSVGDAVLYDGTIWNYLERNASTASTVAEGIISLATQTETDAGVLTNKALTPATHATYAPPGSLALRPARRFRVTSNLVANTAFTVTHGLVLAAAAECLVSCYQAGSLVTLTVIPIDSNSLSVTSNIALTSVTIVVVG